MAKKTVAYGTNTNEQVYGLHAIKALLKHRPESILRIYLLQGRDDARLQAVTSAAAELGIPLEYISRDELDQKAGGGVHQGAIAACRKLQLEQNEAFLYSLLDGIGHPPLLLILDGVTDPHNLGACLRSAEAAGADAVIVPKDKSALMNATVRKVACGAAEIIPFIVVTNLARCLQKLQQKGVWIMGTAGEATQSLYQADLRGPVALVLGAEGQGLRRLTRENCDSLLALPMAGEVSSLNVSVSAGICLFEAVRQRQSIPSS